MMTERKTALVPTRPTSTKRNGGSPAFSLLEVVGVLAVLAIAATIIFAATTKSIDAVVNRQEGATLQAFASAFQNSVLRYRYVPSSAGPSNWCQQIANELGVSSNAVQANLRNPRVLMVDPNLKLGQTGASLPYWQGFNGSTNPSSNCRIMIISSLGTNLPATGISTANFNALWITPDGSLPANGTFVGWNPEDLKIQRLNLATLFLHVQITNAMLTGGVVPSFYVDGVQSTLNPGTGVSAWFLQNTALDLIDENGRTNSRIIIQQDRDNFYVGHSWRDVPYAPVSMQTNAEAASLAQMLSATSLMFESSPLNKNATTTPASFVVAMTNFMAVYTSYIASSNSGSYNAALLAQTTLTNALKDLANNPQCIP